MLTTEEVHVVFALQLFLEAKGSRDEFIGFDHRGAYGAKGKWCCFYEESGKEYLFSDPDIRQLFFQVVRDWGDESKVIPADAG